MKLLDMLLNKKPDNGALVRMLDDFVNQVYWGEDLAIESSKRNLEDSVVELKRYGFHSSNGLLISNDGYFLTAYHCVRRRGRIHIQTSDGGTYRVKKVCAVSKCFDIALAKADMPGPTTIRRFKFYTDEIKKNDMVVILTKWKKLLTNGGLVIQTHNNYYSLDSKGGSKRRFLKNHFCINTTTRPGDSGGVVVTIDGRLIGLVSCGTGGYDTTAVKFFNALELISHYRASKAKWIVPFKP